MIKQKFGFSLVEIMIVVSIISLLSLIAYPNYAKYQTKSKRTDAHTSLLKIQLRMEQESASSPDNSYPTSLDSFLGTGPHKSDNEYYIISLLCSNSGTTCTEANAGAINSEASFVLQAAIDPSSAQKNDLECGVILLSGSGLRSGGTSLSSITLNDCWK